MHVDGGYWGKFDLIWPDIWKINFQWFAKSYLYVFGGSEMDYKAEYKLSSTFDVDDGNNENTYLNDDLIMDTTHVRIR